MFTILLFQLSSNADLKEIDPDDRDKNVSPVCPTLGEHIRNFYPGMEDSPSILESCIYTVILELFSRSDLYCFDLFR